MMYTLTLLDENLAKKLDPSIPANLSFVDKPSALNYAVRHIDRSGLDITTINDATFVVEFVDSGADQAFYSVTEIIDIRTTQYAVMTSLTSTKFNGQHMVLSVDELDDICSKLLYGFVDHAVVLPTKRTSVGTSLVNGLKSSLSAVTFAALSDPTSYTDIVALGVILKPSMLTV